VWRSTAIEMDTHDSSPFKLNYGVAAVLSTFSAFMVYSVTLENILPIPSLILAKKKNERFINMIVTTTHAAVSSLWAMLCFYLDKDVISDIQNHATYPTYFLCCFSTGYFMHDVVQNLRHRPLSLSWEILLHHFIVISCYGIVIYAQIFINYSTVSLLVEFNSIFLHARQLCNIFETPKSSTGFRVIGVLNIATFIIFRICVIGWMTRWLVIHFDEVSQPFNIIGATGLAIMSVMNITLFARVLIRDNWLFPYSDAQLKKTN